jgi:hypothetical protein
MAVMERAAMSGRPRGGTWAGMEEQAGLPRSGRRHRQRVPKSKGLSATRMSGHR